MRLPIASACLIVVFAGCVFLFAADCAYAYIDPGTGSYLLQFLIGALLAGGFAVRTFWSRIKASLARVLRRTGDKPGE